MQLKRLKEAVYFDVGGFFLSIYFFNSIFAVIFYYFLTLCRSLYDNCTPLRHRKRLQTRNIGLTWVNVQHSMKPLFLLGVEPASKFSKKRAWQDLNFQTKWLAGRGDLFQGIAVFTLENLVKSEIVNDK